MSRRWIGLGIVSLLSGALVLACGGDDSASVDGGTDGGADVTLDVQQDAGADAALDAPVDAGYDGPTTLDGGVCDGGAFSVDSVTPQFGWTGAITPITITGTSFVATPTVYLRQGNVLTPLTHVAFVSATSINAEVPMGLAVGAYDVVVVDPDTCAEALAGAFQAVPNAPPVVLSVDPATGTTQTDVPVVVTGCHFPNGATLSTVDSNNATIDHTVASVSCTGANDPRCDNTPLCTMDGTILTKTKAMAPGAYLVRVGNPTDKTWGDYSSFVVTDPSGKLTGGWTAASPLNTGRRSLGVVAGRVDDANRFVYAVGGEDKNGGALSSVEVVPLDRFGKTGKWFTQRNALSVARSGLSVVQLGGYLYAIGGTSSTGGTGGATPSGAPLDTIERARILLPSGAPTLSDPTASGNAGTLAVGTWYYKVAAVLDGTATDNPNGETLPSDEGIVVLSQTGEVSLSWTAVPKAAFYRVYRSPTANAASGSEVLVKDNLGATTYTDTGDPAGNETPLHVGSTGVWTTLSTKLSTPRLDAAAVIAPESSAVNAPQHLYVLGGWVKCAGALSNGVMDCYEYAPLAADGSAISGAFTQDLVDKFVHARMRHGAAALTAANGPNKTVDGGTNSSTFVLLSGGKGISSTGNTVEYALVNPGGALGTFAIPSTGFAVERDGSQLQIANGYAYAFFGGTPPNYKGTSDLSTNASVTPTTVTFGNWSNAGANLGYNVGRHGVALESAYFYLVGGTTDDTDALTTVEQIIY